MGYLAAAARVVGGAAAEAMTPPPPPDILAWAVRNITFDDRSPLPGPFNPDLFPFLREILDCFSPEHPAREVTVRGDAQIGKTTSIIIPTLGEWFSRGALDALIVHPTTSACAEWVRTKWNPIRDSAPDLRRIFGPRGGDKTDTMFNIETVRRDGSLKIAGAGSPSDLTGTTRRLVIMDDLSKFDSTVKGDPETLATSRASAFDDAKIGRISTALIKGACRISDAFDRSDQRLYFVPCPQCGNMAPLTWENFRRSIDPANPHAAHFTCEACGFPIEHKHKRWMVARGEWRPTNPGGDHPGFHLWGRAVAPFRDWSSIAVDYIRAYGLTGSDVRRETEDDLALRAAPAREQVFHNDVLGLPYEVASTAPDWERLRDRVENAAPEDGFDLGRIPAGLPMLTAGVDCQDDRIEVQVAAFGRNARSAVVDYRVIPHKIDSDDGRAALNALLRASWRTVEGKPVALDMLAIDGGAFTNDVWEWAKKHPWSRVIIVKGSSRANGPAYEAMKFERGRDGERKKRQKRAFMVNVSLMKGEYYSQLKVEDPAARGAVGFARGLGDEFYRQTSAEVRIITRNSAGVTEARWQLVEPTRRNEALDTAIYARVAAMRKGWRAMTEAQWDALEAERGGPAPEAQADLFDSQIQPAAPDAEGDGALSPAARAAKIRAHVERLP